MAWDTPFDAFPFDDQQVWIGRAWAWYNKHLLHVERLMNEEKATYPPSGSDCGKPELWKAGHWHWFFNHKQEETNG